MDHASEYHNLTVYANIYYYILIYIVYYQVSIQIDLKLPILSLQSVCRSSIREVSNWVHTASAF